MAEDRCVDDPIAAAVDGLGDIPPVSGNPSSRQSPVGSGPATSDAPRLSLDAPRLSPAERYAEELKEDLQLSLTNLREKSLTTGAMRAKWVGYMAKEKEAQRRLVLARQTHQRNLAASASKKGQNAFARLAAQNQEDELLGRIDQARKDVDLSLEVIMQAISALAEFGYTIKNAIDILKMNG